MPSLPYAPVARIRSALSSRSPTLLFATKSAVAAGVSWEVTSPWLGDQAGGLAVVSALIVVQVTSWQTVRKSIERIVGVIIGVILAVLIAHVLGLNVWTITLLIFVAQIVGVLLQSRGQYLATQIPISAALALVLGATGGSYPLLRMLGAIAGGIVGSLVSLVLSPPVYVFKARDAVADLATQLAGALPGLARAIPGRLSDTETRELYTHIRDLEQRVRATEQAYSLAIDSARLNPWARSARRLLVDYPDVLLALDRLARQMRRIAYTIQEPEPPWHDIARGQAWAEEYAAVLIDIGDILAVAARQMHTPGASKAESQQGLDTGTNQLITQIDESHQRIRHLQEQLARETQEARHAELPATDGGSALDIAGYRLAIRGALLTDLRRMLDEVQDVVTMTAHASLQQALAHL